VYLHIANIDSSFNKPDSITTERNNHFFGLGIEKAKDIIKDGAYHEPAYRSSSLDLSTAYGFAAKERDESGFCNVFMFQTPPGTKALSLGDGEYEYLMPRGEEYVVGDIFNADRFEYKHTDYGVERVTPLEKVRMILLKRVIR